ncbi:MAG: hypothetical protein GY870_21655 [archaeon]|nr:hypothetical protein [archaeon]
MILFRAKIQGTNEWIKGFPHSVYGDGIDSIQDINDSKRIEYIKTDTLSQHTNENDIEETKIFEGDIVSCENRSKNKLFQIVAHKSAFRAIGIDNNANTYLYLLQNLNKLKVVGNIHENPELLNYYS